MRGVEMRRDDTSSANSRLFTFLLIPLINQRGWQNDSQARARVRGVHPKDAHARDSFNPTATRARETFPSARYRQRDKRGTSTL